MGPTWMVSLSVIRQDGLLEVLQLHGINTFESSGTDANAVVFFCLLLHFLFPGGHLVYDVVIIITRACVKQISVV